LQTTTATSSTYRWRNARTRVAASAFRDRRLLVLLLVGLLMLVVVLLEMLVVLHRMAAAGRRLAEVCQPRMFQTLFGCQPLSGIFDQQLPDEVNRLP